MLKGIPPVAITDKGKFRVLRDLVCRGGDGREDFPEELTGSDLRTDAVTEINRPTSGVEF